MRKVVFRLIIGLFIVVGLTQVGIHDAKAFLEASTGARATAMGGSFTPVADDADAIFYNPSGLVQLSSREIIYTNASIFLPGIEGDNLGQHALAIAQPLGFGTIGLGYQRMGSKFFSENGITLSLARRVAMLNLGVNVNALFWSAEVPTGDPAKSSKFGFGLDAGALLRTPLGANLGVFLKNLVPPNMSNSGDEGGKLPMDLHVGLGFKLGRQTNLAVEFVENDLTGDKTPKLLLGGEVEIGGGLSLRAGVNQILGSGNEGGQLNGGLGYRLGGIRIGYSYVYDTKIAETDGVHRFSVGYKF